MEGVASSAMVSLKSALSGLLTLPQLWICLAIVIVVKGYSKIRKGWRL
jgi:hypothetical protein